MTTIVMTSGVLLNTAMRYMGAYSPEGSCTLLATDEPHAGVLFFRTLDSAGIAIVECKLKCTYEGELFDIGLAYNMMPTDLTGMVQLDVNSQLVIHHGPIRHKITPIDVMYIKKCPEPKCTWPLVFDIPATEFKMYLKAVCDKSTKRDSGDAVRFTWDAGCLIIEDIDQSKIDVTLTGEDMHIRQQPEGKIECAMPADFMKDLLPTMATFDRLVVGIGHQQPITIGGTTADGQLGCGIFIAPRIL